MGKYSREEIEKVVTNVMERVGNKLLPKEDFVNLLREFTNEPFFYVGVLMARQLIAELWTGTREYYVKRDVLNEKISKLEEQIKKHMGQSFTKDEVISLIKDFIEREFEGLREEDRHLASYYCLGRLEILCLAREGGRYKVVEKDHRDEARE